MRTGKRIKRLSLNQIRVGVPPLVSASVGAEFLFLSADRLLHGNTAVFADVAVTAHGCNGFRQISSSEIGFYRIDRYACPVGDALVAEALRPQPVYNRCLLLCHNCVSLHRFGCISLIYMG